MSELLLITGKKGHGKTLWTVDEGFKQYDQGKFDHYYSDITGLRHKGFQSVDDWRDCADNSLIILDEVQFKKAFNRAGGKFEMQVIELTTMRKRGVTIWLITQRARLLNADVLALVDRHIHVERNGEKTSRIYEFGDAEMNITKTKKLFAQDKYVYTHNQEIYAFYESIKEGAKHYKKSYINKGVVSTAITLALVVIFGGYFIYSGWTKDGMKIGSTGTQEQPAAKNKNTATASPGTEAFPVNTVDKDLQTKVDLCVKQFGWTVQQCIQAYDPKAQQVRNDSLEQSTGNNMEQVVFKYNASKPFDNNYEVNAQPVDFPKFSGCMKKNGRYVAYTQQGTILKDVSASDCQRVIENGDRPFDYFKQSQQPQMVQQVEQKERNVTEQPQMAQHVEQRERSVPEQPQSALATSSL